MKPLSRQIKKIEKKESKGPVGQWRREFCKKYPALLVQVRENTHRSLLDKLAPKGNGISCQRGCTHCCYHYVTVSVAHGIAIVDYLYKNRKLLTTFIANYESWQEKGGAIADHIDHQRLAAQLSSKPLDRILAETRPLSQRYLDMHIPCPFLQGDSCFIYDVRPLSCSGHFSVSQPHWCAPDSPEKPEIHHLIPDDADLVNIVSLADPRLVMYELTFPRMIHKLLTEGSPAVMDEVVQHNF